MTATQKESPGLSGKTEIATLGGGCFWCVEAVYQELQGVIKVESGYAGGHVDNPTYREVCSGLTGHAEVVQVTFDPQVIGFKDLLDVANAKGPAEEEVEDAKAGAVAEALVEIDEFHGRGR